MINAIHAGFDAVANNIRNIISINLSPRNDYSIRLGQAGNVRINVRLCVGDDVKVYARNKNDSKKKYGGSDSEKYFPMFHLLYTIRV